MLGVEDPDVDVEVIALADGFYRALGLERFKLFLNSMGDPASRLSYVEKLSGYLLDHADALGPDFRERVEQNPLRVLDSKRDDWQDVIEHAPQITEHLSDESREHFERVQIGSRSVGYPLRARAAPRPRVRLLHEHHVRVPARPRRRRADRRSAGEGATTSSPSSSAARPLPGSASGWASNAC